MKGYVTDIGGPLNLPKLPLLTAFATQSPDGVLASTPLTSALPTLPEWWPLDLAAVSSAAGAEGAASLAATTAAAGAATGGGAAAAGAPGCAPGGGAYAYCGPSGLRISTTTSSATIAPTATTPPAITP